MKKILLSVAILAVAASCSTNETVSVSSTNSIGFSTLNDRVTKVANTNAAGTDGATTNSDYTVFAGLTGNTTGWYIDDATLSSDDIANGTYYWPSGSSTLDFYAFAPAHDNSMLVLSDVATTSLGLVFTVPTAANVDFTIATPVLLASSTGTDGTSGQGTVTSGKVSLQFSHMLSKATIDVALSDGLDDEYVMTFGDITFTAENNTVTTDAVAAKGVVITGASSQVDAAPAYTYAISESATAATSFTGIQELMFAPHATSVACKINIANVTITNTKTGEVIVNAQPIEYPITSLTTEAGTAYNFIITISADKTGLTEITFSSTEADWTTATTYLPTVYATGVSSTETKTLVDGATVSSSNSTVTISDYTVGSYVYAESTYTDLSSTGTAVTSGADHTALTAAISGFTAGTTVTGQTYSTQETDAQTVTISQSVTVVEYSVDGTLYKVVTYGTAASDNSAVTLSAL